MRNETEQVNFPGQWVFICCERKWKRQPVQVLGITLGKLSINELVSSSMWQSTPVLLPGKSHGWKSLQSMGLLSRTQLSDFTFTFHFLALEKEMATCSSVLAWRIPGMREPGGLPSMGLHRVGHDWSDLAEQQHVVFENDSGLLSFISH